MILPIPPMGQRDPRWSSQRLGTVNATTIGSHGCVITSMAMLATYYNHPITPNQIDDILTERGLYYDGNLFVNDSITKIFSDIKFDKVVFCETVPAPMDEIKKYLDAGKPVVVSLINFGIRHYVLAVGYEDNQIIVNDPWMGDQVSINSRWGDSALKILQVNFFSGPVPKNKPATPSKPPISSTQPIGTAINDQTRIDLGPQIGTLEVQAIRSEITDLRRRVDDQERLLQEANRVVEEALQNPNVTEQTIINLGSLGNMSVSTIIGEITSLRDANTRLQQTIKDKEEQIIQLTQQLQQIDDELTDEDIDNQEPGGKTTPPPHQTSPWASRKLWLSIVAAFVAFLNSALGLNLDIEKLLTIIGPLLAYVGVEGLADVVERARAPKK